MDESSMGMGCGGHWLQGDGERMPAGKEPCHRIVGSQEADPMHGVGTS
ncbi:MAG: hypothetical protein V8R75_01725 [Oscillospiraceae bacterium]